MPNQKISELDPIVAIDDADVLPIVDTSVTTTKKISITQVKALAPVQSVASKTGEVTLVKGDVGLGNVDNTADADKPVSTATQTQLNSKISTYDGTTYDVTALSAVTQAEYDAIGTKSATTLYFII
jgi:hypothetical protein